MFLQVNSSKVQCLYFDFHDECKNMRWDRKLQEDLADG
jgi:hypothetical protein